MVSNVKAIVLAAGKSTRFRTKKSKLLHSLCGQAMILYPAKVLEDLHIPMTFVLGYQAELVKNVIVDAKIENADFVIQENLWGTGNAVLSARDRWDKDHILILNGDTPLLTSDLISGLIKKHLESEATISFLATYLINPTGYGRIKKDGDMISIIEEKNCTEDEKEINKVNAGVFLIRRDFLEENLEKVDRDEVSGEIYLTELVRIASEKKLRVNIISVPYDLVRGVNTLEELWAAEQIKRSQLMKKFMNRGVRFELAQNIHLDIDVEIGAGSFIATGVHLLRGARIGEDCFIGAFSIIDNSVIEDGTKIYSHTVVKDSRIGKNAHIGPFARLRDNVILKENITIGNFVEIKNSIVGKETKTKHLTYVGDAIVGDKVNIGAGTITCNHDGVTKNQTIIEDEAFIGSNNTIIAPVKIGKGSYTAAGSTINRDVGEGDFAIARQRQENKKDYAKKLKDPNRKKRASNLNINFLGAIKTEEGNEETV